MTTPESDPERDKASRRDLALREVASYAIVDSDSHDAHPYRLDMHVLKTEGGVDVLDKWASSIESAGNMSSMFESMARFIDDRRMPNITLAAARLRGRWDGALDIESQLVGVRQMLEVDGYRVISINRNTANPTIKIVPGYTSAKGFVAVERKRPMIVAFNPDLPEGDVRRKVMIDKRSWFVMDIDALGGSRNAAKLEAALIIACSMLIHNIPFSGDKFYLPDELGANFHPELGELPEITLDNLHKFLRPEAKAADHAHLAEIIGLIRKYGMPENLVIGALFNPQVINEFMSPVSKDTLEEYIAACTPEPFGTNNEEIKRRMPGLLTPAAVVYYAAGIKQSK